MIPPYPYDLVADNVARDLEFTQTEKAQYQALLAQGLPPLVRTEMLSVSLGVSLKLLGAMANVPRPYYKSFSIAKRTGEARQIQAPRVFLKTVQRWILLNILYKRTVPDFVTGFVPGRGLVDNARMHVGKRYLTRIDIADFFPSIGAPRVREVFSTFGYPEPTVNLLSGLCVYDNGLPQGAPTSPYLANLVFSHPDEQIKRVSDLAGIVFSRYADDLTFSADRPIDQGFVSSVEGIIENEGFRLNRRKFRQWRPGQRLITTGLVVHTKPQPPRRMRRLLRAKFHQARNHPMRNKREAAQLHGWAAYVNMYDSSKGQEYLQIAKRLKS